MKLRFALIAALTLSACGFHPRGETPLAASLATVVVDDVDPYSVLARDLKAALARSGATLVDSSTSAAHVKLVKDAVVVEPLSIGSNARVQEYLVRYQVTLTVLGGDGKVLLDKVDLELSREFSFDATQALGAASEQELITNELRREMLQQVLRRIATVR